MINFCSHDLSIGGSGVLKLPTINGLKLICPVVEYIWCTKDVNEVFLFILV